MEAQFVVTGDYYGIVMIEDLPTDSSVLALSLAGNTVVFMPMPGEPMVRPNPTPQLVGHVIKNVWHYITHPAHGPTHQFPQYALRGRLERPSPPPVPRPR